MLEKKSSLSTRQQSKFILTHSESIEDCSLQRASDKKKRIIIDTKCKTLPRSLQETLNSMPWTASLQGRKSGITGQTLELQPQLTVLQSVDDEFCQHLLQQHRAILFQCCQKMLDLGESSQLQEQYCRENKPQNKNKLFIIYFYY